MNLQSQVVTKIRRLRHEKGFLQSQMAELLDRKKSLIVFRQTAKNCH
jgi:DNA-binding XRE family transcriptional regulator